MSLISDADKALLTADLLTATQTFWRPLTIYQEAQRTVVSSNPNYNPVEAGWNQNSVSIENVPVQYTVSGSIKWSSQQELEFIKPEVAAQLKVKDQFGAACRLKVDASGYALLQGAKKVQIDGVLLDPISNPRPHGLFGTDRYTFYFKRA